jgi:hypothetical protein
LVHDEKRQGKEKKEIAERRSPTYKYRALAAILQAVEEEARIFCPINEL